MATENSIGLTYSCFAYPPEPIKMYEGYTLGKDKKGYFVTNGNAVLYYDYDFIKMLFTPTNKTWDEITL